jgi:hypothetical protein
MAKSKGLTTAVIFGQQEKGEKMTTTKLLWHTNGKTSK